MADVAHKPASYADIDTLPPHVVGEILFGQLVTHPRPARRHGGASSVLGMLLGTPYQLAMGGPGGWVFVDEPELRLGPHIVVPGIAGWRRERVTEPPDKAYFEVAPEWVCEALSPRTEKHDRGEKRRIYAHYNVDHLWHDDARARLLEVFRRQDRDWLPTHTFQDEDAVRAPPYEAVSFSLKLLWPFDLLASSNDADD